MKTPKGKKLISFAIVLLLVAITINYTYASFFTIKTNTNSQYVKTGTLNVAYGNSSTSLIMENLRPMSDEEGLNQSESSYIHIENTGNIDSNFVLTVGYDLDNFPSGNGNTLTPIDFIKVAVYRYVSSNEEYLIAGPVRLSDLPIYENDTNNPTNNRYSLLTGKVGGTSSGNATANYKVKTWLSSDAGPEISYTYLYVNSTIVATAKDSYMNYSISGKVLTGCTAINNAKVSIHNGSYTSTTNSSGAYSFTDLYPGVYNIDITADTNNDSVNEVYSGNITIAEGSSVSIAPTANVFTGSNIYDIAYTNKTTIYKIFKKNNITDYTQTAQISSGSLPVSYILTGGIEKNIQNIDIVLNNSTNTFTITNNSGCNS